MADQIKRRLQFVWPYWHGGANGDEIRFSVRSVEKFFDGEPVCTIIGDRPPWFSGHCIIQKQVPRKTKHRGFRDTLSKLWTAANSTEIDYDFVWMMDDIYFLKPVSFKQVSTPMAEPFHNVAANSWQMLKCETISVLSAIGETTHDYATHLPQYVEKDKIKSLFSDFGLHERVLIWEILYGNRYRENPIRTRPFLARLYKQVGSNKENLFIPQASVMNHIASAWTDDMRNFLIDLLPDKSPSEMDDYKVYRKTKKSGRVVKRRPRETHRDYIEANKQKAPS